MNFEQAIKYKVYETDYGIEERNGNYRIYISDYGRKVNLGTHDKCMDAKDHLVNYMVNRFIQSVSLYGLDPYNGRLCKGNYVIFETGEIFNLKGHKMKISKNAYGHDIVCLKGRTYYVDTVYNWIFNGSKNASH